MLAMSVCCTIYLRCRFCFLMFKEFQFNSNMTILFFSVAKFIASPRLPSIHALGHSSPFWSILWRFHGNSTMWKCHAEKWELTSPTTPYDVFRTHHPDSSSRQFGYSHIMWQRPPNKLHTRDGVVAMSNQTMMGGAWRSGGTMAGLNVACMYCWLHHQQSSPLIRTHRNKQWPPSSFLFPPFTMHPLFASWLFLTEPVSWSLCQMSVWLTSIWCVDTHWQGNTKG